MKRLILTLSLLVATSVTAVAKPIKDCTFTNSSPESLKLDLKSKYIKIISAPVIDEGDESTAPSISVTVKLKDGTVIEHSAGGCYHYGYSYKFQNIKNLPKTLTDKNAKKLIAKHLHKISKAPFKDSEIKTIIEFLQTGTFKGIEESGGGYLEVTKDYIEFKTSKIYDVNISLTKNGFELTHGE